MKLFSKEKDASFFISRLPIEECRSRLVSLQEKVNPHSIYTTLFYSSRNEWLHFAVVTHYYNRNSQMRSYPTVEGFLKDENGLIHVTLFPVNSMTFHQKVIIVLAVLFVVLIGLFVQNNLVAMSLSCTSMLIIFSVLNWFALDRDKLIEQIEILLEATNKTTARVRFRKKFQYFKENRIS